MERVDTASLCVSMSTTQLMGNIVFPASATGRRGINMQTNSLMQPFYTNLAFVLARAISGRHPWKSVFLLRSVTGYSLENSSCFLDVTFPFWLKTWQDSRLISYCPGHKHQCQALSSGSFRCRIAFFSTSIRRPPTVAITCHGSCSCPRYQGFY